MTAATGSEPADSLFCLFLEKKEWVIDIKSQCDESDVPFFFKQWGRPEFNTDPEDPTIDSKHINHAKGGCLLDGQIYRELPEKYRKAS